MKINKKGFMMAELVVVSAIVLTTLVSLYTSIIRFILFIKVELVIMM